MRNRFFLVIFVFVVLGLALEARAERALVMLGEGAPALAEVIEQVEAAGGRARISFPPGAAIVEVPEGGLPEIAGVNVIDHVVDVQRYAELGIWARAATLAWNAEIGLMPGMPPADKAAAEAVERAIKRGVGHARDSLSGDAKARPGRSDKGRRPQGLSYQVEEFISGEADDDTSEYLIGSVYVSVFLMESTGSSYDWSSAEINQTITGIFNGLSWWIDESPDGAELAFVYDLHPNTATAYEPITMDLTDDVIWIQALMSGLGYTDTDVFVNVDAFNDDLRDNQGTEWAFTIFVADSDSSVNNGDFADDQAAHSFYGGPWFTMSRFSTGTSFSSTDYYEMIPAHEMGHTFYAVDEYDMVSDRSGYFNTFENNGDTCVMNVHAYELCDYSRVQVGWLDTDDDGILDILDTEPQTLLDAYTPDPTASATLTYNGDAMVVPLTNLNTNPASNGNDITLNVIDDVEYRVNGGAWQSATGSFFQDEEEFSFQISPGIGTHTVEARAVNNRGNVDPTPASDTVTVVGETLTVVASGDGTVTSSPAGIDCGSDCSEEYLVNTVVALTATPYSGESFSGWSGAADCSDGSVTMNVDKSCTATFTVCDEPATIVVDETLSSTVVYKACETITGAADLLVETTADVTFAARDAVYLQNGASVESGAEVHVRVGINAL